MKRLYTALLIFPVIALLTWWAGMQVYLRLLPSPRWVLQSNGVISNLETDLNTSSSSGAALAVPVAERSIPSRRAALIAWQTMRRQAGQNVTIGEGPSLVIISYPDGLKRLTWRSIALLGSPAGGARGIAMAAYVDASSGEPMAVVENMIVVNPALITLAKPAGAAYWVIFMTNGPLLLLGAYLILLALALLLRNAWRNRGMNRLSADG